MTMWTWWDIKEKEIVLMECMNVFNFIFFPEIFYDKTLPSQFDESRVKMSSRKYVSNSKYGNIYKIQ